MICSALSDSSARESEHGPRSLTTHTARTASDPIGTSEPAALRAAQARRGGMYVGSGLPAPLCDAVPDKRPPSRGPLALAPVAKVHPCGGPRCRPSTRIRMAGAGRPHDVNDTANPRGHRSTGPGESSGNRSRHRARRRALALTGTAATPTLGALRGSLEGRPCLTCGRTLGPRPRIQASVLLRALTRASRRDGQSRIGIDAGAATRGPFRVAWEGGTGFLLALLVCK